MNRNHLFVATVVLCAAAFVPASVSAATATANLSVTASVAATCTISTTDVAFGAYDPVVTNLVAPKDGTGKVTVACTKGSIPAVGLGLGLNPLVSARRMLGASGDFLTYELYQPADFTTVWGNSGAARYTPALAPGRAGQAYTVNGRIVGGQDVAVGTYADTVVATVNF